MAKKKKEEDTAVATKSRPKIFTDFADDFFPASSILEEDKKIISVSPSFDLATGGVPEGCFIALTGKEKIGKTTLALWIAAKAQMDRNANQDLCPEGRHVFYSQVEHRLKERDLKGLEGILNMSDDRFTLIQSSPGKILTSEDHCHRIERAVHEVPGCVVVVDSFSMLSSEAEQAANIGYQDRGKSNTIIAQLMRKIAAPLAINKCIVIGITHGMANTSGYGAAFIEKSASSLKYAEDIKLAGKGVKAWRLGEDEKAPQIGQETEWLVQFAAINAPGARVTTKFRFGIGIDETSELIDIAEEFALIEKAGAKGAWYTLPFIDKAAEPKKYNGKEQIRKYLEEDPSRVIDLRKQVYDMAGMESLL